MWQGRGLQDTVCSGLSPKKGYNECRGHGYGPDVLSVPGVYMILPIGVAVLEARKGLLLWPGRGG